MAKARNGYHDLDISERASLRGRPAGRTDDPVRKEIGRLGRSLREIKANWEVYCQWDDRAGDWLLLDRKGAEHAHNSVELLGRHLSAITSAIDEKLKELAPPSRVRAKVSARKLVKKRAGKKAAKAGKAAEAAPS